MCRTAWLAIFLAAQAWAQAALFIDLWVPWRVNALDDTRFAAPDFDDGHGKTVALPHPSPAQLDLQLIWRRRGRENHARLVLMLSAISENNDITVARVRRFA